MAKKPMTDAAKARDAARRLSPLRPPQMETGEAVAGLLHTMLWRLAHEYEIDVDDIRDYMSENGAPVRRERAAKVGKLVKGRLIKLVNDLAREFETFGGSADHMDQGDIK